MKKLAISTLFLLIATPVMSAAAGPAGLPADVTAKIDAATDPAQKCIIAISAAQSLIKGRNAAAYGDWLLGVSDAPPPKSVDPSCDALLTFADKSLADVAEGNRAAIKSRIAALRRFEAVFVSITASPSATTQPENDALLEAASDLAEYLDDPNDALAESARLWQAAAYWRAGKSDRALKILRPIVSDVAHPRIGLVSRLFRVRLLAKSGQPAAALAHCTRIANRVDLWFADASEVTRESAHAAVRAVQISCYEDWSNRLSRSSHLETGTDTPSKRLAELKKNAPSATTEKRFRLKSTIGGLGSIKLAKNEPAATTQDSP